MQSIRPRRHASAATVPIDATRGVEVGDCIEAEQVKPAQQATEVGFPLVVPCSRNTSITTGSVTPRGPHCR